jgi:hypothetical protein
MRIWRSHNEKRAILSIECTQMGEPLRKIQSDNLDIT